MVKLHRKNQLADNRITVRLSPENLKNFLEEVDGFKFMSDLINIILYNHYKKNGK
jgi:hypothetical protein